MSSFKLKTPVAIIIFNRPDTTEKVFEVIRQVKPPKLFVIADGSRPERPDEAEKCAATRAIIERVDWECEVLTNYSDINLGCRKRVSSGLDWVFETVEEAIILEDDCFPDPTFFQFCEELLERYREDQRIMSISAISVPSEFRLTSSSYYFSQYHRCWGWATWKRAWKHYHIDEELWLQILDDNFLKGILPFPQYFKAWKDIFKSIYDCKLNSWAYQWLLAHWLQNSLTILPEISLVSNLGLNEEATHTKNLKNSFLKLPAKSIKFPLEHPNYVFPDANIDLYIQKNRHNISFLRGLKSQLLKVIN